MPLKIAPALFHKRADDEAAFERLYERHVEGVFRYAVGMLGDAADAEDVTQTTFLNAYRAFKSGTRPDKPHAWLIAIAHNVCRQRFRQSQRRPREVAFDEGIGEPEVQEPTGPTVDELRRALSELPPNQRSALVMRELEGCSYSEIAGVLGVSVSALEALLFRARRALREQLEERLSCHEAALAINRQLDGRLGAGERRALRAHLRACGECNSLAQSQRAQRRALKSLVFVPLPVTLAHWNGANTASAVGAGGAGGLTAVGATTGVSSAVLGGAGVAAKVAAVVVAGVVFGGGAYEGVTHAARAASSNDPTRVAILRSDAAKQQRSVRAHRSNAQNVTARTTGAAFASTPAKRAGATTAATTTQNTASGGGAAAHQASVSGPAQDVNADATTEPQALGADPSAQTATASGTQSVSSTMLAAQPQAVATHVQAAANSQSADYSQAATHSNSAHAAANSQSAAHTQSVTHSQAATKSQSAAHSQSASHSQGQGPADQSEQHGNSGNGAPGNSDNASHGNSGDHGNPDNSSQSQTATTTTTTTSTTTTTTPTPPTPPQGNGNGGGNGNGNGGGNGNAGGNGGGNGNGKH